VPAAMKKVLIADDHAIFREGLKQVIAKTVDMVVVAEAENGQEVLRKVQTGAFDLVILDISMPGRNGLDLLTEIKKSNPRLPVLVLSMHPEEQYAARAFKAGAAGYLTKGRPSSELLEALQKISLGKRYVSASLAESLAGNLAGEGSRLPQEELSIREYQVMCLIAAGKRPQQIADDLAIGVKTFGTYRARILKKMNMKSNAELIRYVLENGLE
jgi:two-component system, NarL family, invasion response regulator UvrY